MNKMEIRNLNLWYGEKHALKDTSLDIPEHKITAFIGPSGCGKSTTLRMIAGLEDITSGELKIGDRVVNDVEPKDRDIAMVFQNYALYPHMTVYDNMAFGLKLRKVPKDQIDKAVREAARILDLEKLLDRKPKALSGGQRQRVAMGRAIVRNPKVFLMDEPLSNLDAKLRNQMRAELIKLRERIDTTFIYVTHDQEEALTLSDRIAVFNKGIIEQIGTPNEVYNHSQTEFVCNFIGDINRLNDDTVSALRAAGAEVDASKHNYIRLERLHVNVAPRGGEIALDGTVESCEYYGLYIKYYIHVGTQSLKVIEKNDGVNIYDPGQRVKVILNPNDIMAYAPSAEEVE